MKHKVFLVDDHPLVREWLTNLINQQADLSVCGNAEDAPEALAGIAQTQPRVAIVDLALKTTSGLELIKDLRRMHPEVAIIVLSMHEESLYAERALRAGARGYVMKRESTKNVIAAIRTVMEGHVFVSEQLASQLAERLALKKTPADASPVSQLSDRELEVFDLMGGGAGTKQIADSLHISIKTVQAYQARIKEKLGVKSGTELLREAIRWADGKLNARPPSA